MSESPFGRKLSKAECGARGGMKSGETRREQALHRRSGDSSDTIPLSSDLKSTTTRMLKRKSSNTDLRGLFNPTKQTMKEQPTKKTIVPPHREKKFQPNELYLHVPKHIPVVRELPNTTVNVPVTLNLGGGQAILLSDHHNPRVESGDFWADICKKVEKFTETCSDETFGTIVAAKSDLKLELWSLYFPSLVNQYGTLKHYKAIAERPMSAKSQKTLLTTILRNATKQLEILDKAPTQLADNITGSAAAGRLLSLYPTPVITGKDHLEQLQKHTAQLTNVAEDIRRELSSFAITISKVADQACEDKRAIQVIASHIFKIAGYTPTNLSQYQRIDVAQKLEAADFTLKIKQEGLDDDILMQEADETDKADEAAEAADFTLKIKQEGLDDDILMQDADEAAEAALAAVVDEPKLSKDKGKAPADSESDKAPKPSSIPLGLIHTILDEAHPCRCPKCQPEASERMVADCMDMLRQEQIQLIEDEARGQIIRAYKREHRNEALEQARKEAADEAKTAQGQEFLAELKEVIRAEIRAEVEKKYLAIIKKQAKEELMAKMAAQDN